MVELSVTFQPGDTVQTAPPPPPPPQPVMTVIKIGTTNLFTGTSIECEWYVNGARVTGWFKPTDLHLVAVQPPALAPKS